MRAIAPHLISAMYSAIMAYAVMAVPMTSCKAISSPFRHPMAELRHWASLAAAAVIRVATAAAVPASAPIPISGSHGREVGDEGTVSSTY
jgi:hypothetical protein